ncbi:unnamed protein product [Amoebophrya sp. A120]|nr:unnamed protein product [Amoebophrya sp. A120]|eukprot:GSA120T00013504001.1
MLVKKASIVVVAISNPWGCVSGSRIKTKNKGQTATTHSWIGRETSPSGFTEHATVVKVKNDQCRVSCASGFLGRCMAQKGNCANPSCQDSIAMWCDSCCRRADAEGQGVCSYEKFLENAGASAICVHAPDGF